MKESTSLLTVAISFFFLIGVENLQFFNHTKRYIVKNGDNAELRWNYKLDEGEELKTIVISDNDAVLAYKDFPKGDVEYQQAFKKGRYKDQAVLTIDNSTVKLLLKYVLMTKDTGKTYHVNYMYKLRSGSMDKSSSTMLDVVDIPKINKANYEKKMDVVEGHDVSLPCKAVGTPVPNITWFKQGFDEKLESGKVDRSLELKNLRRLQNSNYTCVASNIAGEDRYTVSVNVQYPPTINKAKSSSRVGTYLGNSKAVYLECAADGNPTPTYKWNNMLTEVYDKGIYPIQQPREFDFGSYNCEADNGIGTDRHEVTVYKITKPHVVKLDVILVGRRTAKLSFFVPYSPGNGARKEVKLSYKGNGRRMERSVTSKEISSKLVELTNLTPHTSYEVNVTVTNEYFLSDGQREEFATKEDVPGPPSNVALQVSSPNGMRLSWDTPIEENGKITKYKVDFSSLPKGNNQYNRTFDDIPKNVFFKDFVGLRPYSEYVACVIGSTTVGFGHIPVCINATTEALAPGSPQNVSAITLEEPNSIISLSWLPPEVQGTAPLTYYEVNITCLSREDKKIIPILKKGLVKGISFPGENTIRKLQVSQLPPFSDCKLKIREGTGFSPRWGNYSLLSDTIAMPESAPENPKNLRLVSASHDHILLSWDRPSRLNGILKMFVIEFESDDGDSRTLQVSNQLYNKTFFAELSDLKQTTQYTVKLAVHTENYESTWIQTKIETAKEPTVAVSLEVRSEENDSGPIIGGVLSVIVIIVMAAGILLYISRRKKRFNRSTSACSERAFFEKQSNGDLVDGRISAPVLKSTFLMNEYEKNAQCTFIPKNPVPIHSLKEYVQKCHTNKDKGFSDEFKSIKSDKVGSLDISSRSENKCKNRYANILAYDHSRVVLNTVEDLEGSDYVNANYIDGYNKKAKFIATQGPVVAAFNDFWRMIWEQDASKIIMVTNLVEKSRIKCQKYWPDIEGGELYGNIKVEMVDELLLAEYVVRRFSITQIKDNIEVSSRTVTQYQFLSWPDHGVPQYPTALLQFVRRVRALDDSSSGPIVCHCSAGVGRTGTYITLDALLDQIEAEKAIDVLGYVSHIRGERNLMVQTEAQYVFIYDVLLEAVLCGDTEVNTGDLFTKIKHLNSINPGSTKTYMEEEFERVSLNIDDTNQYEASLLPCNAPKNRYPEVLPFEQTRVKLWPYANVEGSDYINGSFLDGYQQREAYILTQSPLENTVEEFWRMLWEYEVFTIVMISSETERTKHHCWPYWPLNNDSTLFGILAVQLAAEEEKVGFIRREFRVINSKNGDTRIIHHFMYFNWPLKGSPETAPAIEMIGQVQKTQQKTGNSAIVVHCSDGSSRSGSLAALMYCLERLKLEGLVDVFQTVRSMRTQRVGLVKTQEQYQFIYMAVSNFLDCFSNYANFK